jgi:hypothetical protein
MNTRPGSRARQRVVRWLGILGLALWFGGTYVFLSFFGTRPHFPEPDLGRVYELNNHGDIVYLTLAEQVQVYGTMGAGFCCLLLAGVIKWRIIPRL